MRQVNKGDWEPIMDPTEEQQQAIDLFQTGKSLAIEAGAGTGKTSTLVMIAKSAGSMRGQYVAFNKALVEDSKPKFMETGVFCNTAHSLAYRGVGHRFAQRLRTSQRMFGPEIASRLGLPSAQVEAFDGTPKVLYAGFLASQVMKTVTLFCQSADEEITIRHTPRLIGLDPASAWAIKESLVPYAQTVWADLQRENGWAPYKHEHYLKAWQLADPVINVDYILFDEAQDANPVIAAIVAAQADHAQLIYVGDSQQEIYAWTGAVNALAKTETDNRTYLTQSFRFGQAIADRANEVLDMIPGAELRLTGNPAIDSRLERLADPRAVLTRTNAMAVSFLLNFQLKGKKAHLIGGAGEMLTFARGAQELMDTGRTSHPDLVTFNSWGAVQAYVQQDEGGEDLRLMVKLMDNFGSAAIVAALERMPNEGQAEVVISTAHKSKGREWESVQLANDFPQAGDSDPADLRLLYVSVTRAKEVLDSSAVDEPEGDVFDPTEANEARRLLN